MLYRHSPFILASLVLFLIYYLYSNNNSGNNNIELQPSPSHLNQEQQQEQQERPIQRPRRPPTGPDGKRLKTVLYWNEFYGRYDTYDFGYGHEAFKEKESCRIKNCFATKDRSLLPVEEFDAIIIHIRGLPNDMPLRRSQHQRYVMLSVEAPLHLYEYRSLNELNFNWSMTYRLDSDFPIPYAWIDQTAPLPGPKGSSKLKNFIKGFGRRAVRQGRNLAEGKVGLAVQFASNCHSSSQRELYVRELRKYIPVDVYGKCGEFTCAVASSSSNNNINNDHDLTSSDGGWDCFGTAQKKYKFLLAFEDAVCKDYVTETFFSPFNDDDANNVVPVVLGGANYSALGAPPHSYIDSADFKGPKQLAHFLKLLDADDARYNEYFWWRGFYKRRFGHHDAMCDLCRRLNMDENEDYHENSVYRHKIRTSGSYEDMEKWWVDQAECKTSNEAPVWVT